MTEWWSYRVSDLLLFSPRTYFRLVESYNRAVWPAHLVAMLAGISLLVLVARRARPRGADGPPAGAPTAGPREELVAPHPRNRSDRWIAAILGAAWLWVAWAFHFQRYASINWAAKWFALAFCVEALLLIWVGVVRNLLTFGTDRHRIPGLAITIYALFIHPLATPLAGRPWATVEIFGIAPDPTAIATLGIALLASGRVHGRLLAIPLAWCLISAGTLRAMEAADAWVISTVTALGIAAAIWKTIVSRRDRRDHAP